MPAGAELYYWSAAEAIKAATDEEAEVQLILSDAIDEVLELPASRIAVTSVPGETNTLSGGVLTIAQSKELKLADIMLDGDGILDIDGGSVVLGGMVGGNIGTSGGTKADTNLFGRVEADLDYDTLTNSAACFVNAELAAYGVAITNSTQTKLAWSTAIAADGSYTDPNGDVWYCVGDVPENEVEVDPVPIAFSALRYDSALGEYTLVVTNLVAGCWYSLYATNSLVGGFVIDPEVTPPVTNFQAEVDGEFELVVPQSDSSMFWKMTGESGTIRK
jgi:hypothetical protein